MADGSRVLPVSRCVGASACVVPSSARVLWRVDVRPDDHFLSAGDYREANLYSTVSIYTSFLLGGFLPVSLKEKLTLHLLQSYCVEFGGGVALCSCDIR